MIPQLLRTGGVGMAQLVDPDGYRVHYWTSIARSNVSSASAVQS